MKSSTPNVAELFLPALVGMKKLLRRRVLADADAHAQSPHVGRATILKPSDFEKYILI